MALVQKQLVDLVAVSRSTGGGRFNAQGQYEWLAANQPRFDFNPSSLQPRGLLVEEQRTNLLMYSSKFDNPAWSKINASVTDGEVSFDGLLPWKILTATGTSYPRVAQTVSLNQGYNAFSLFIKSGSVGFLHGTVEVAGNTLRLYADLASRKAEAVTTAGSVITGSASIADIGSGAFRISVDINVPSSGVYTAFFGPSSSYKSTYANIGDSIKVFGAQLETGFGTTSLIQTDGAQLTRAADVITAVSIVPWLRGDEGTLLVSGMFRFSPQGSSSRGGLLRIDDDTSDNFVSIARQSLSTGLIMHVSNGGKVSPSSISESVGTTSFKAAMAFRSGDGTAMSVNGGVVIYGDSKILNGISKLRIGGERGAYYANGWISRVSYIPRRLSDSDLRGITV